MSLSTTNTSPSTERERLADEIVGFERKRIRAVEAVATAEGELARLEKDAGASILDADDPLASEQLAATMGRLHSTVTLQGKVAAEATKRADAARCALLRQDAAELEAEAASVHAQLKQHEDRVQKALETLRSVAGMDYRPVTFDVLIDERRAAGDTTIGMVWHNTPGEIMQAQLLQIETRKSLAIEAADDWDRAAQTLWGQQWEDLPRSVREGSVIVPGLVLPEAPEVD